MSSFVRKIVIAVFITSISIVSVGLIQTNQTYAESFDKDNLDHHVKLYSYYQALLSTPEQCVYNNMRSIITRGTGPGKNAAPDAEDSPGNEGKTWFGSNQKVWVWPREQVTCAEAMKRLIDMKSSDAQRYANFLTSMNGRFWDAGDPEDCEAGTTNTKPTWVIVWSYQYGSPSLICGLSPAKNRTADGGPRVTQFKAAVGTEPTLSNAATFHAYYSALNNTAICTTRVVPEADRKEYKNINNGVGTDVSSQLSARIGSTTVSSYKSFYYDVPSVDSTGKEITLLYEVSLKTDTTSITPPVPAGTGAVPSSPITTTDIRAMWSGSGGNLDCVTMAALLHQDPYKSDWLKWMQEHKSTASSVASSTKKPTSEQLKPGEPGGSSGDGTTPKEEDQENCKIDYIGWVICPVVNTLASMSEGARARLVKMLTVDTKSILGDTSEGSVYSYWSKIRDYANILFVIFFLFVIYSQITGYGLDNYGIKRMLPKLIVGVIAVNVSFYICGLLIDLSNVVGSSAFNFISTAAVGGMPAGDWNDSDQGWISSIAAGALLLTVGYFALATVISVLLFVVITAVTTIFLLGVREAIIILCTVISPLAFAAMIMPNTEGLYKKWWNVFKASLMVFPMVGLVYGASNLAARILGASVEDNDFILKSVITLLIFAPLPVVPKLVKSAVEIIGIGGLVAGAEKWMNKKRGAMTDKVGKWRENKLTSQFGKHRREKAQLRNAQIRGGTYRGRGGFVNPRNWRSGANRRFNAMSGDFGQKRKLAGSAAALAEDNERMKAANAWIADNNMSSDRLAEIATGFTRDKDGKKVAADLSGISSYQRRAAMQALAPHMTSKQASDLAEASASFGDASLQKEAANAIAESGAKKAPWLGGKQLEAIRQGTYNEEEAMGDYIKNKASGSGLANADADAVRRMVKFSADQVRQNADSSYMRSLINARADLEADPKTAGTVPASVRAEINKIPPLRQQQTHGASNSQGTGGSQGSGGSSGGNPSPKGSTPPPNPGSGSGGQGPQNSTPPPKPSNTPDTPKPNSSSDPGSDSGSSNSSDSSSSDSSGGDTTTHNGQTFTQTSSGLYIPKH